MRSKTVRYVSPIPMMMTMLMTADCEKTDRYFKHSPLFPHTRRQQTGLFSNGVRGQEFFSFSLVKEKVPVLPLITRLQADNQ